MKSNLSPPTFVVAFTLGLKWYKQNIRVNMGVQFLWSTSQIMVSVKLALVTLFPECRRPVKSMSLLYRTPFLIISTSANWQNVNAY